MIVTVRCGATHQGRQCSKTVAVWKVARGEHFAQGSVSFSLDGVVDTDQRPQCTRSHPVRYELGEALGASNATVIAQAGPSIQFRDVGDEASGRLVGFGTVARFTEWTAVQIPKQAPDPQTH